MVRVRSLRTQQRAKSQCTCTNPVMGPVGNGQARTTDAKIVFMVGSPAVQTFPCQQPARPVFGTCLRLAYRHSMESLILAQDERWRRA
jgi:hypothetical protein